jgi:hypothetical protein
VANARNNILFAGNHIGYTKTIYIKIFHSGEQFDITVKSIEQNGILKRVFVSVSAQPK